MLNITRIYNSYDALTSTLLVDVLQEFVPDDDPQATPQVINTWQVSVHLPVNGRGQVLQDASMIEALVQRRIQERLGPFTQQTSQIPPGGVVNPDAIYSQTQFNEAGSLPLGSYYVLLTPDPASETGALTNLYTRSIMRLITSRTNFDRPFDVAINQLIVLDNGNIVASSGLFNVESVGVTGPQAGFFVITAANDNTDTLAVTPWVLTTAPDYVDNMAPDAWANGYDFYQVFIEHDPIEMQGTTTAIFSY